MIPSRHESIYCAHSYTLVYTGSRHETKCFFQITNTIGTSGFNRFLIRLHLFVIYCKRRWEDWQNENKMTREILITVQMWRRAAAFNDNRNTRSTDISYAAAKLIEKCYFTSCVTVKSQMKNVHDQAEWHCDQCSIIKGGRKASLCSAPPHKHNSRLKSNLTFMFPAKSHRTTGCTVLHPARHP